MIPTAAFNQRGSGKRCRVSPAKYLLRATPSSARSFDLPDETRGIHSRQLP